MKNYVATHNLITKIFTVDFNLTDNTDTQVVPDEFSCVVINKHTKKVLGTLGTCDYAEVDKYKEEMHSKYGKSNVDFKVTALLFDSEKRCYEVKQGSIVVCRLDKELVILPPTQFEKEYDTIKVKYKSGKVVQAYVAKKDRVTLTEACRKENSATTYERELPESYVASYGYKEPMLKGGIGFKNDMFDSYEEAEKVVETFNKLDSPLLGKVVCSINCSDKELKTSSQVLNNIRIIKFGTVIVRNTKGEVVELCDIVDANYYFEIIE